MYDRVNRMDDVALMKSGQLCYMSRDALWNHPLMLFPETHALSTELLMVPFEKLGAISIVFSVRIASHSFIATLAYIHWIAPEDCGRAPQVLHTNRTVKHFGLFNITYK